MRPFGLRNLAKAGYKRHTPLSQRKARVFEQLESRRLLANITVTNLNPNGDGSLLWALNQANSLPGSDTIDFDSSLFSGSQKEIRFNAVLGIETDVTIKGPGADKLKLTSTDNSVVSVGLRKMVTLSGITLSGARGNFGAVTNYWQGSELTIEDSKIVNNNTMGVFNGGGTLNVINSTIANNTSLAGGGIINYGTATIIGSTLSGNSTPDPYRHGGAVFQTSSAQGLTIINSTISGNRAGGQGGGIFNDSSSAPIIIRNSTIVNNTAGNSGGGIHSTQDGIVELHNTIVAGNTQLGTPNEIFGAVHPDSSHNLIGSQNTAGGLVNDDNNNNIVGNYQLGEVVDPTLRNNGGFTLTHALIPGSPAIDAGDNEQALNDAGNDLLVDQRGDDYGRIANSKVDIGAFEYPAIEFLVSIDSIAENRHLDSHTVLASLSTTTPGLSFSVDETDLFSIGSGNELFLNPGVELDFESSQLLQATVRLRDEAAQVINTSTFNLDIKDLVEVSQVSINGDSVQRSRLDKLTIEFDGPVQIGTGAFKVFKRLDNGTKEAVAYVISPESGVDKYDIKFDVAGSRHQRSHGALVDGNYELVIDSTKVQRNGQRLDADEDGDTDGDFTFGDNENDKFFALFGDSDGDRDVDGIDFGAFRRAYGRGDSIFNYNDDKNTNDADFLEFRKRFGTRLSFY